MRRALLIALTALLLASASASKAEVEQLGNLRVHFSAEFTPQSLPRQRPAPIEVNIQGSVATTDGSHPPPLQVLEVKLNRSGRLFTRGLPTCRQSLLQSTSSNEALARCGAAPVGRPPGGAGDFQPRSPPRRHGADPLQRQDPRLQRAAQRQPGPLPP